MRDNWSEAEYREAIRKAFEQIERAFENVDPDVAECEQALGSMTITLKDNSRCILSSQPSVRQLWLAVASLGVAFHFDYDPATRQWVDDKGKGVELMSFLEKHLREKTGTGFHF